MTDFMNRLMAYIAKQKDRKPEDFYSQTAVDEMGSVDSMMGALSAAVGGSQPFLSWWEASAL